jgi:hypothetical protein
MTGKQSVVDNLLQNTNLPFTDRVTKFPLPDKFKVPQVELYDGLKVATKHFKTYRSHVILHGMPKEIVCQAFPLTLKESTRRWFETFPTQVNWEL